MESAESWINDGAQFFEEALELALILKGATDIVDSYRKIIGS